MQRTRRSNKGHSTQRETRRLFLALWPEPAVRQAMADVAGGLAGGRKVAAEKLHLTLFFLGNTTPQQLVCLREQLREISVPALALTLDHLGYWPRQQILWLGASQPPEPLLELIRELNERLPVCHYVPDKRPFRAHITLARKFPGPPPFLALSTPIVWRVDQMALVESRNQAGGVQYEILQRWPQRD